MTLVLGGNENNMESILDSIKKMILGNSEETHFDMDIIIHINSVFATLNQMGVGPEETFTIDDDSTIWSEFTEDDVLFNNVKTYMYLKVKLIFDPPASSSVLAAMERQISELEWRLNVSASNKIMEDTDEDDE